MTNGLELPQSTDFPVSFKISMKTTMQCITFCNVCWSNNNIGKP